LIEARVTENESTINKASGSSTCGASMNVKKASFSSSRCESSESINSNGEIKSYTRQRPIKKAQHSRQSSNTSSDIYLSNSLGSGSMNGTSVDGFKVNGNFFNSSANSYQSYSPTIHSQSPVTKQAFVAKINVIDPNLSDTVYYKKIIVKDSDRCKEVKRMILSKFNLDPEKAEKYTLIQVFEDGSNKSLFF
jgi:hypothetical protein